MYTILPVREREPVFSPRSINNKRKTTVVEFPLNNIIFKLRYKLRSVTLFVGLF